MGNKMDIKQLAEFLIIAREKCSYEAPGEVGKTVLSDGTKQIGPYTEGVLSYIDTYNGSEWFAGREEITNNGRRVWTRDYKGGIIETGYSERDVSRLFGALKAALRKFPRDKPFKRGPSHVKVGSYKYSDQCEGDMSAFTGTEKIIDERKEVYICNYHGGLSDRIG